MSTTIEASASDMFRFTEPYRVSGSVAELGDKAAKRTWDNAMEIASHHDDWLKSDLTEACEGIREWASRFGVWEKDEIAGWSVDECLALFVQNVAHELRMLGSDDDDFDACVERFQETDWDKEPECPTGHYYTVVGGDVFVEFYTGV